MCYCPLLFLCCQSKSRCYLFPMELGLIRAPAPRQQQASGQGGFPEGCCPAALPWQAQIPSRRKPKECLLCAVEIPGAQGNMGESVHLPLTRYLPAAPQERGRQKAKALLHLHSRLSEEDRAPLIPTLFGCHFTAPCARCQGWRDGSILLQGTGEGEGPKHLLPPRQRTTAPLVLRKHQGLCLGSAC